jgi:hypothetical protein
MQIFLLTLGFLLSIMAIMSVGVIFSNKELKGSCGGPGKCECELAGKPKACQLKNPS